MVTDFLKLLFNWNRVEIAQIALEGFGRFKRRKLNVKRPNQ